MAIESQLPIPAIPDGVDATVAKHLANFYARLRNWVSDTATHLGNFQGVPTANQIPTTGQVLMFDGTFWRPGNGTAGTIQPQTNLDGAKDGTNVNFTAPFDLTLSGGRPTAVLIWRDSVLPWTADNPPPVGMWTFGATMHDIVLGMPPVAGDFLGFALALSV